MGCSWYPSSAMSFVSLTARICLVQPTPLLHLTAEWEDKPYFYSVFQILINKYDSFFLTKLSIVLTFLSVG